MVCIVEGIQIICCEVSGLHLGTNFCIFFMQVLESVVKNCGQTVHDEVANKQTMEELKELLKVIALRPFFFTVS